MTKKPVKTGKRLEKTVAQAYRDLGAVKVEHDVDISGHQIDVYTELETVDRGIHRIAIEVKDYDRPVGIKIVRDYSRVIGRIRDLGLIDEGLLVSPAGYTRQARDAALDSGIRLLEIADLTTHVRARRNASAKASVRALLDEINSNLAMLATFVSHEYRVESRLICSRRGEGVLLEYVSCMTAAFDSEAIRQALTELSRIVRDDFYRVYRGFRRINDRAQALHDAFRMDRASLYLKSVQDFRDNLWTVADHLEARIAKELGGKNPNSA